MMASWAARMMIACSMAARSRSSVGIRSSPRARIAVSTCTRRASPPCRSRHTRRVSASPSSAVRITTSAVSVPGTPSGQSVPVEVRAPMSMDKKVLPSPGSPTMSPSFPARDTIGPRPLNVFSLDIGESQQSRRDRGVSRVVTPAPRACGGVARGRDRDRGLFGSQVETRQAVGVPPAPRVEPGIAEARSAPRTRTTGRTPRCARAACAGVEAGIAKRRGSSPARCAGSIQPGAAEGARRDRQGDDLLAARRPARAGASARRG